MQCLNISGLRNAITPPPPGLWFGLEYLTGSVDDIAYKHKLSPRPTDASRENGPKAYAHVAPNPKSLHGGACAAHENDCTG